jgi:hypothetical protein
MVLSHYPPDLILAHLAQMLGEQSPVLQLLRYHMQATTSLVESPDFNKRAFRQPLKFHVPSHGRTDVTIWTRRKSRVQPGGVIHVNFK